MAGQVLCREHPVMRGRYLARSTPSSSSTEPDASAWRYGGHLDVLAVLAAQEGFLDARPAAARLSSPILSRSPPGESASRGLRRVPRAFARHGYIDSGSKLILYRLP